MAMVRLIRRGLDDFVPPLHVGEMALCLDSNALFIGTPAGNRDLTDFDIGVSYDEETNELVLHLADETEQRIDFLKDQNKLWSNMNSAGRLWGGEITDNEDGTVTITAGGGLVKDTDVGPNSYSPTELNEGQGGTLSYITWDEITDLALLPNSYNYIYYDGSDNSIKVTDDFYAISFTNAFTIGRAYHSVFGTPEQILETGEGELELILDVASIDLSAVDLATTTIRVNGTLVVDGGTPVEGFTYNPDEADYILSETESSGTFTITQSDVTLDTVGVDSLFGEPPYVLSFVIPASGDYEETINLRGCGTNLWNYARRLQLYGEEVNPVVRATGLMIGVDGLTINYDAGIMWAEGTNRFIIPTLDTNDGDTFTYWYGNSDDGFVRTVDQTDIDNTNYYHTGDNELKELTSNRYGVHWVYVTHEGNCHVVYGSGNYTLAQAQNATAPTAIPGKVKEYSSLIGKIIIQKSNSTPTEVLSPFTVTLKPSLVIKHDDTSDIKGDGTHHLSLAQRNLLTLVGQNTVLGRVEAEDGPVKALSVEEIVTMLELDHIDGGDFPTE